MAAARVLAALLIASAAGAGIARADDARVRSTALETLDGLELAARGAAPFSPTGTQTLYDGARDAEEALRRERRLSASCHRLAGAMLTTVRAHRLTAEGIDRLSPRLTDRGRLLARRGRTTVTRALRACRPGAPPRNVTVAARIAVPGAGDAFFGTVVAHAPEGSTRAEIRADGRPVANVAVRRGTVRAALSLPAGKATLTAIFRRADGSVAARATSRGAWVLPSSARRAAAGRRVDQAAARRLATAARTSGLTAGLWVQNLSDGTVAAYNADARFPAASSVKLALLMGALGRVRGVAARDALDYDLRAMAGWSSNLATNRLLRRLGGPQTAIGVLRRAGATRSTFTGGYLVGTALQPRLPSGGTVREPPRTSGRVTTARDLGRLLHALHAAAAGDGAARRATGLTTQSARRALGMLLASEQAGDNRSLVSGGFPTGTPIAQKNGWIRRARLGAAIAYTEDGPRIVVVTSHSPEGVSVSRARRLGVTAARALDG